MTEHTSQGSAVPSYPATVQLVPPDGTERERPFDLRVSTRAGAVELALGDLSGGEALHFALAMCVFNNVARESRDRGLRLTELAVTAEGGFDAEELSTGIAFSITIAGDGPEEDLRSVATFGANDSTIAKVLRHPTAVELRAIEVRAAT